MGDKSPIFLKKEACFFGQPDCIKYFYATLSIHKPYTEFLPDCRRNAVKANALFNLFCSI